MFEVTTLTKRGGDTLCSPPVNCSKSLVVCSYTVLAVPPLYHYTSLSISLQEVNSCLGQIRVGIVGDGIFK